MDGMNLLETEKGWDGREMGTLSLFLNFEPLSYSAAI